MAIKPIIEIDVNDEKFKQFTAAYAKWQDNLKKAPGAWDKINAGIGDAGQGMGKIEASARNQVGILDKVAAGHRQIGLAVSQNVRYMEKFSHLAQQALGAVKGIAVGAAKWAGLGTLLGGLGGYLGVSGYERLANVASGTRIAAGRLGVSPGDLRAAEIAFARFGGAGSALSGIADIQTDISKQYLLRDRLGISQRDIESKNAGELLPQTLAALQRELQNTPTELLHSRAGAMGWTQFMSIEDLRQLRGMSPAELQTQIGAFQKARGQVGFSDASARKMQDFIQALETATAAITGKLINSLSDLAGPLGRVVTAFGDLINTGLNSPEFKEGVKQFAEWLEGLGKDFNGAEAKKTMVQFIHGVGEMARIIKSFVDWFNGFFDRKKDDSTESETKPGDNDQWSWRDWFKDEEPGMSRRRRRHPLLQKSSWANDNLSIDSSSVDTSNFGNLEKWQNLPPGVLKSIMWHESRGNPNAYNPNGGASGAFQFIPSTAQHWGLSNPFDPQASADAASRYLGYLMKMFGGDLDKALASYSEGENSVKRAIREAGTGDDWRNHLSHPGQTLEFLQFMHRSLGNQAFGAGPGQKVSIRIENATGGNNVVTTAALAAMAA
jgi:methyl-accepting chemotaxis protein